ncbi:DUF3422 domain-containing protein [Pontibacterium sp.]|uniref:DUF3422 domain-containing protein n=1 Tax=Pontibacterium sp. TaxID=2036026 RepID=UPI003569B819
MYNYHQRQELLTEVHSRPFQPFTAPLRLLHFAVLYDGVSAAVIEQEVLAAIRVLGFVFGKEHRGFLFVTNQQYAIRYEPHNEFYTLTLYHLNNGPPFTHMDELTRALPGALLVELEIQCERADAAEHIDHACDAQCTCSQDINSAIKTRFASAQYCVSQVMNGSAIVATDFRIENDRQRVNILVKDIQLQPAETGRLLQRLCELETYRHMALLSLPTARELMPEITVLDQTLAKVSQRSGDDLSEVLSQMTELAAKVESISAATANRFSASDAYFALVERCIQELREQRIEGGQMIAEFMDRHLRPAQRTCDSAAARTELLSRRIARATELVQSQVNLHIEEQNKALLEALNARSKRKMGLETKLESLSVVVVVYYLYDLMDLALKNLLHEGETLELMLTGLTMLLPFLLLLVMFMVRRLVRGYRDE